MLLWHYPPHVMCYAFAHAHRVALSKKILVPRKFSSDKHIGPIHVFLRIMVRPDKKWKKYGSRGVGGH